ncbi:MAG: UDP-N-acetylmuramoyl-L-alanine--D-glutamate ligase [Bacteroidales bacterium]
MSKRIVILGAGESGVGAAVLAQQKGFEVFVSNDTQIKTNYRNVLLHHNIIFEEGRHSANKILCADEVIKSPGIADNAAIVAALKAKQIPVISEIEFAGRYTKAKTICITGSNGKTTTTLLTYHILKNAGLNVGLAGNVGKSFAMEVAISDFDYYVLEISSFQLDGMFRFKADIAVLLNITPDHLDRYNNNFQEYADSKFRITRNQTAKDSFIFCHDDPVIKLEMQRRTIAAKCYPFSIRDKIEGNGAFMINNDLVLKYKNDEMHMTLEELALQGKHNLYNSMAAGIAGRLIEIRKDTIKQCLSDFQNVEHRLEFVANIHGVEFINDSKATNVNSTWWALESLNKPVIWIAGGKDKGNDYSKLFELVRLKVKAIVCLGIDNSRIFEDFSGLVKNIVEASSAAEAVAQAYELSRPGDVVILSPSCASFDLFENFEDRGRQFKKAVRSL